MARLAAAVSIFLVVGCGFNQPNAEPPVDPFRMTRIRMVSEPAFLPLGETVVVRAVASYANGMTADVTNHVEWESANPEVLDASYKGLLVAKAKGVAAITARAGTLFDTSEILVTEASLTGLSISPSFAEVPAGMAQRFTVTGRFSDGTQRDVTRQVTFVTDDADKAEPDDAEGDGVIRAYVAGEVGVTAHLNYLSTYALMDVGAATLEQIEIDGPSETIAAGTTASFAAFGRFSDGTMREITEDVTWSTTHPSHATITENGEVSGWIQGEVEVVAEKDSVSAAAAIWVEGVALDRIEVETSLDTLAKGDTMTLRAIGVYVDESQLDLTDVVSWSSSQDTVFDVKSIPGVGRTYGVGNVNVYAQVAGKTGMAEIKIKPAEVRGLELEFNDTRMMTNSEIQLHVYARYSDTTLEEVTEEATWITAEEGLIELSSIPGTMGLAQSNTLTGTATVTANYDGFDAITTLRITDATLQSVELTTVLNPVFGGTSERMEAIGHYSDGETEILTFRTDWQSSDSSILEVSNTFGSRGALTVLGSGTVDVTATVDGVVGALQLILP